MNNEEKNIFLLERMHNRLEGMDNRLWAKI